MNVAELAPGLWRWTAPHPDWTEADDWAQEVGCVYYEAPGRDRPLIDPLVPRADRDRFFEALDRDVERRGLPVAILLTGRLARAQRGRAGRALRRRRGPPGGVEAFGVPEVDETLWWLPEHGALVAGDVLLGAGRRPRLPRLLARRALVAGLDPGRARSRCSSCRSSGSSSRTASRCSRGGRAALEQALR